MATLLQDLRYVSRALRRSPGFTVSVVVILALGIGACASIFNLVNAYFLRPPAGVSAPDRLVHVRSTRQNELLGAMSYSDYADLRDRNRVFSGLMAFRSIVLDLGQGRETRRVQAALVSSNYFAVLGAGPVAGRAFLADEERHTQSLPAAVISNRLWRAHFGADPGLVGRAVTLNGRALTVVGVAPPAFGGHVTEQAYDVWVPLSAFAIADPGALASVDSLPWRWLTVVGRLAPGVTIARAEAEVSVLARRLAENRRDKDGPTGVSLAPTRPSILDDTLACLLIASVGVLFVIACANLSSLFLARAGARRAEVATRLALGAPRGRVLRLFLTESVVLGLLGGVAALVLATPASSVLLAWSSAGVQEFPDPVDLGMNAVLFAFVLVLSTLSGFLLGVGPALRALRLDRATLGVRAGCRSLDRSHARSGLVVFQLALSLVLLSGAGLLFRTLRNYESLVAVRAPEQVLLLSLQPAHQQYDEARTRELLRQLHERVSSLPGVQSASLARDGSMSDRSFFTLAVAARRIEPGNDAASTDVGYNVVAPDYLRTTGVGLEGGRDFSARDLDGARPVVIVNAALGRRLWPGRSPLGQELWIAGERSSREVIGIAADRATDAGPQPFVYTPLSQRYPWAGSRHLLIVRASAPPLALVEPIRREAGALAPDVPLFNPRTLDREIAGGRFFERLAGAVVGGAGLLALILAAAGLHGVTTYSVSLRTYEFGVRMAMGARPGHVFLIVLWQAMTLSLAGVAIGLGAALASNRIWTSLLFGVHPVDPAALVAPAVLLMATTLAASYLPARRATRIDPVRAIRAE
jgi:predicted permease